MKRLPTFLLVIISLLLPATPAAAQNTLTFLGGVNLATLDISTMDPEFGEWGTVRRLTAGLAANISLGDRLDLQLGGSYAQKGASINIPESGLDGSDDEFEAALQIDYLELAVLGRARALGADDGPRLHILAGPFMAFEASCQSYLKFTLGGETREDREDCGDEGRSTFDYGVAGGGEIQVGLLDNVDLSLSALYTFGLANLDDAEGSEDSVRSRALSLRAGLVIPIG